MKDFKFFQKQRKSQSFLSFIKLKDIHNRDKYLQVKWMERISDTEDPNCLRFEGNILEFYTAMGPFRFHGTAVTPIIYEIYMKQSGYFNRSLVFQTGLFNSFFISRRAKLTILYKI